MNAKMSRLQRESSQNHGHTRKGSVLGKATNGEHPRGIPLIKKAEPLNPTSRFPYLYCIGVDRTWETIGAARARTAARFI
jgi:hypothetical protein